MSWPSSAALGVPVEPLVNRMTAARSGSGSYPPSGGVPVRPGRSRSSQVSLSMAGGSVSCPASSIEDTTEGRSRRATWLLRDSAGSRKLSGAYEAPAQAAPNRATGTAAELTSA